MSERDLVEYLQRRSERGTERGAERVWEAAQTPPYAQRAVDPPIRRYHVAFPVALVAVTLLLLAAVVVGRPGGDTQAPVAQEQRPGDVHVCSIILHPGSAPADLQEQLASIPEVLELEVLDAAAAESRMRELFSGDPSINLSESENVGAVLVVAIHADDEDRLRRQVDGRSDLGGIVCEER